METISLEGLDKAEVLAALYNASHPQGLGFLHYDPTPMTIEKAREYLAQSTYFDYLEGRVMKIDLSGDELNPWAYDRDNGAGAAEAVILTLRAGLPANNDAILDAHAEGTMAAAEEAQKLIGKKSTTEVRGGVAVFHLGVDDAVSAALEPKLDEILKDLD